MIALIKKIKGCQVAIALFVLFMLIAPIGVQAFLPALLPVASFALPWIIKATGGYLAYSIFKNAPSLADLTIGNLLEYIAKFIRFLADIIFGLSASVFDFFLPLALDSQSYDKGAISASWMIFRDIANMSFIFAILYLAITTILQAQAVNLGKGLTTIIIAALLVNFSLGLTRATIDISNILGTEIWSSMADSEGRVSTIFVNALSFDKLQKATLEGTKDEISNFNIAFTHLSAAFFLLLAGLVLAFGGFLMLTRTFILILLMVLSPVAVAAMAIPSKDVSGYGSQWLSSFLNNIILGPLYLIIIWISARIVTSPDFLALQGNSTYDSIINGTSLNIIFSFGIVIFLLSAAVVLAGRLAPRASELATYGLNSALGMGAFAGRQTVGRFGKYLGSQYGDKLRRAATDPTNSIITRGAAGLARGGLSKASTYSYDLRNVGGVGAVKELTQMRLAQGEAGGYIKEGSALDYLKTPDTEKTELEKALFAERIEEKKAATAKITGEAMRAARNAATAGVGTQPTIDAQSAIKKLSGNTVRQLIEDDPDFVANNREFVRHLSGSQLEALERTHAMSDEQKKAVRQILMDPARGHTDTTARDWLATAPGRHFTGWT